MKTITLYEAFDGFILEAKAEGKSTYTIRNYQNTIAKVKLYLTTDRPLADITRVDWVKFFSWIQNDYVAAPNGIAARPSQPLSAKTVANYHTDLRAFYTWATSEGVNLVSEHLIRQIPCPRYERAQVEPFTRDEIKAMLKACSAPAAKKCNSGTTPRAHVQRNLTIIHLLLSTGVRASELCNIRLADIDLTGKTIHVSGKGKGRDSKPRTVYFGKVAARILWLYLSPRLASLKSTDVVFTVGDEATPRPLSRDVLLKLLKRIGDRAGVPNVHPHRFRHTFATEFLKNGGDLLKLQTILGHESLDMVRRYAHVVAADCAAAHASSDPADNWKL